MTTPEKESKNGCLGAGAMQVVRSMLIAKVEGGILNI